MGIGVSILLLAVGAVLAFAVHVTASGFDVNTVGVILMVVGGIGLLVALLVGSFPGWGPGYRRTTYVEPGAYVDPGLAPREPVRRRRVVRDTYLD